MVAPLSTNIHKSQTDSVNSETSDSDNGAESEVEAIIDEQGAGSAVAFLIEDIQTFDQTQGTFLKKIESIEREHPNRCRVQLLQVHLIYYDYLEHLR